MLGCGTEKSLRWGTDLYTRRHSDPNLSQERNIRRRPARIILVRHGESWGNVDEKAYEKNPDSQIELTPKGMQQAMDAGKQIRQIIGDKGDVYFYVSPYRRALQTLLCLGQSIERHRVSGVREEPRLREQDFGNFQRETLMKESKRDRARFGRFFFRFPEGESASDVYDRITGFRETLRNDMDLGRFETPGEDKSNVSVVIVSHGLTLRVFLMRWFKWSVSQFDRLRNLNNCEVLVMERGEKGRYSLTYHHDEEYLKEFGFDDDMVLDQHWAREASSSALNVKWPTSGNSFFDKMSWLIDGALDGSGQRHEDPEDAATRGEVGKKGAGAQSSGTAADDAKRQPAK